MSTKTASRKLTAMRGVLVAACLMTPLTALEAVAENYVVIVNEANPVENLSERELSRMFLRKVTRWDMDAAVIPIDLPAESEVRETFSREVLGKAVSAIKAYWTRQIFSGNGVPPVEKSTDDEVVAFVRDNRGAIGYVSSAVAPDGVKVVELR